MTTELPSDGRREAVLSAFVDATQAMDRPPTEEWAARHPEFAEDIRRHAEVMRLAADAVVSQRPSRRLVEEAIRGADASLERALLAIGRTPPWTARRRDGDER